MNKYIKEFNQTGNSTINVALVSKNWGDNFSISTWINENEEKYTLIIRGKRKGSIILKSQIYKEQAIDVVRRLNLVHVKSGVFRSAGSFHSKSFIKSELDRFVKIKEDKEKELAIISNIIYDYSKCY